MAGVAALRALRPQAPNSAGAGKVSKKLGRIVIMAFPRRGDSYTECFYPALESLGVEVREGIFAGRWLLEHLRGVDYVHLNWPSFFYNDPRPFACLRKYALFLFFLALVRWRKIGILWTVHNLYPHDRCVVPGLDRITRLLLVRIACLLLVHGESAAQEVRHEFPRSAGRMLLVDHGNWIDYYPNSMGREFARHKLNLPHDKFVFLFIGACKPYKDIELLIAAVSKLSSRPVLMIVGRMPDPKYELRIRAAIENSPANIRLYPGFVPHDEMQLYVRACDVVAATYNEVLTSGTAMVALSFGRPVVAPSLGFLKDIVSPECGVLYEPSAGMQEALEAAMSTEFDEAKILAQAMKYNWLSSAQALLTRLA